MKKKKKKKTFWLVNVSSFLSIQQKSILKILKSVNNKVIEFINSQLCN